MVLLAVLPLCSGIVRIMEFYLEQEVHFQVRQQCSSVHVSGIPVLLRLTPLSTYLEHLFTDTLWWNEYFATVLNMLLNFVTEFLFQRYVVYGKSIDSAVNK